MSDHAVRLNDRVVARARSVSRGASVLVMLVGLLALAGWVFDAEILKSLYAGISMKANTAVALLLAGASLWLLDDRPDRSARWRRFAGQACAVLVGGIGVATLSQHVLGWSLGIDQLLFREPFGAMATTSPGRMGPPASICFALTGTALLLLHRRRGASIAQLAALGTGLLALLAITGYAYGAETLYGVARFTGIALHTAIALFALGFGLLAASVDRGIGAVMAGDGAGSLMARRLIGFAIAVPLLLGWLRIALERTGDFDTRFGIALLILSIIVILTALITRTAVILNRVEQQKLVAEAKERERLQEIETMVEVLREARAEAEAANRAKDDFIATVSHELRTPLNAVLGWASILSDGTSLDVPTRRRALDTIQRVCKAQAQLIDDLMDISRIVAGQLRLELGPVDLSIIIHTAAEIVRPAADDRKVQLHMALDPTAARVQGDAARLQQVVWNLLVNAVKFSAEGDSVEIRLDVGESEATITIADAGQGIDPGLLPHIFERFRQADGSGTGRQGGLGLGLSIARNLVQMHGGTLEAASDGIGHGSRFTIRLPLLLADSALLRLGHRDARLSDRAAELPSERGRSAG